MDDKHAQRLQKQVISAVSELRAWIWLQHSVLLPDDVSAVTLQNAKVYSEYLDWYSQVEEALKLLESAAPGAAHVPVGQLEPRAKCVPTPRGEVVRTEDEPTAAAEAAAAPTARAPSAARPRSHSGIWHRTIPIVAPAEEPPTTRRSAA